MKSTELALYRRLEAALTEIEYQIAITKEELEQDRLFAGPTRPGDPKRAYRMQDRNGSFILAPLLVARADLLSSMAVLKVAK